MSSDAPSVSTAAGELLAKPSRTLVQHTQDVLEAFDVMYGTPGRATELTRRWMRFFRLPLDTQRIFLANGRAAAICHDWGKANDGFQRMLQRRGDRQLLRHEQVSVLLMNVPSVRDWLSDAKDLDLELIAAAVLGHHLKASNGKFGHPQAEIDQLLRVRWDDADLQKYLSMVSPQFGLTAAPGDVPKLWSFDETRGCEDLIAALDDARDQLDDLGDALEDDAPRRRLLWAVRAALIAADAAGSALPRQGQPLGQWLTGAFDESSRLDDERIQRNVIAPRLEKINISEEQLNRFQIACGNGREVPERALLIAPCGSGKTLAAWRWIQARCGEESRGRAIFLYPTRGTATEGYRDYLSHAGPGEAALVHGTADLELDDIHSDVPDEQRLNEARLFALRQWPKRLFSATVDQFLGFMQHAYGPTCHLPLLTDSVVVFDEVHSYDRGMFSALLEFLKHFEVPVLCMTATLMERRGNRLRKGGEELGEHGLQVVDGLDIGGDGYGGRLKEIADYGRYRITRAADDNEAEERVREALEEGKRVLWVVNTVDRAQEIARRYADDSKAAQLTTQEGVPIYCYHSRYRLKDRKAQHEAVVQAFKPGGGGGAVLAVTTQVCEMSLDLDTDVLVSEWAPAASLVQRMGRCCRDADADRRDPPRVGEVILYEPPGDSAQQRRLPYTKQDLEGVEELVAALASAETVSQSELEDLLGEVPAPVELPIPKACRFIESGPWAASGEENFREIADLTRPVLLADDVELYRELRTTDHPWRASGLILPVPKKYAAEDSQLPPWLSVASGGRYVSALGYCLGIPGANFA